MTSSNTTGHLTALRRAILADDNNAGAAAMEALYRAGDPPAGEIVKTIFDAAKHTAADALVAEHDARAAAAERPAGVGRTIVAGGCGRGTPGHPLASGLNLGGKRTAPPAVPARAGDYAGEAARSAATATASAGDGARAITYAVLALNETMRAAAERQAADVDAAAARLAESIDDAAGFIGGAIDAARELPAPCPGPLGRIRARRRARRDLPGRPGTSEQDR